MSGKARVLGVALDAASPDLVREMARAGELDRVDALERRLRRLEAERDANGSRPTGGADRRYH